MMMGRLTSRILRKSSNGKATRNCLMKGKRMIGRIIIIISRKLDNHLKWIAPFEGEGEEEDEIEEEDNSMCCM